MTSFKRKYKPTKDLRIYDVPKPYMEMFNKLHQILDLRESRKRSKTEFFNDLVMYAYEQHCGVDLAASSLRSFQKREALFEKHEALLESLQDDNTGSEHNQPK